jgi:hypothetical protein
MSTIKLLSLTLVGLVIIAIIGILLPWLFSAKSTTAVLLGILVIIISVFTLPRIIKGIIKQ